MITGIPRRIWFAPLPTWAVLGIGYSAVSSVIRRQDMAKSGSMPLITSILRSAHPTAGMSPMIDLSACRGKAQAIVIMRSESI